MATTATTEETEKQGLDAKDFLATFPNAPSAGQIEVWKQQAPGARVRMITTTDMKRVYIMRGIGGTELSQLQGRMPQNIAPEKLASELQIHVSVHCCLWTSATQDGKLTDMALRASGSGLPQTLHEVVSVLSDYMDPVQIERLSADL